MKNKLIAVLILCFATLAYASDDVVFATTEDAAAFDNSLVKQQNKAPMIGKAKTNPADSVNVRNEVIAAQNAGSVNGLLKPQNPGVASAISGSKSVGGIAAGGASTGGMSGSGVGFPTSTVPAGAPISAAPAGTVKPIKP